MFIIVLLTSFIMGVAVSSLLMIPVGFIYSLFFGSLLSLSYVYFLRNKKERQRNVLLIVLFLIGFSFGMLRLILYAKEINQTVLNSFENKTILVEAIITEPPRETPFNLRAAGIVTKVSGKSVELKDKGLFILPLDSKIEYGDKIGGLMEITKPESFENEQGITFNYPNHLRVSGVTHILEAKEIEIISHDHAPLLYTFLYKIRNRLILSLKQIIDEPFVGLLSGILIGDKNGLEKDLKEAMTKIGVIHIAVFSGQNVGIMAIIIFFLLSPLPYRFRIGLCFVAILLFVLMSGAEPPAVRAGIFASIVLLGKIVHRKIHSGRAILLTLVLMLLWNPLSLIYDISFQLSFVAMLGLIYISPYMPGNEIIKATLAAQIAVLPLILKMSGMISLWSVFANLLIAPIIAPLMIMGIIIGTLQSIAGIFQIILWPFGFVLQILLAYITYIVNFFNTLPWGSMTIKLSNSGVFSLYIAIILFMLWLQRNASQKETSSD